MRRIVATFIGIVLAGLVGTAASAEPAGDAMAGARAFRACMACHSLQAGRHMTGPSLHGIWGRRAGTVEGFARYSPALTAATVVWNETSLESWLADPKALIPGNTMTFAGVRSAKVRADLIAFLKASSVAAAPGRPPGGGMMRAPQAPSLKALAPNRQVTAIRRCGDSYFVTTASGETRAFWEQNLRFKTDASATGPATGRPVLMPAGMMGDRASIIFAEPAEISRLIEEKC